MLIAGSFFPQFFLLCGRVVLQDDVFAVSYQPLSQAFGFGHWQVITFLFYQNAFVIFISRTYHSNGHSQNMKRNIIKIIAYSLFVFALIILFKIFYPRRHSVPIFQKRNSTQYWNLLNGSKIGYTFISVSGPRKSFPIIYLHGGPGGHITDYDIKIFRSIADSGYDVYLYDQTGSGQSERLADIGDYTVERHIEDLKEIIEKINSKKVILVGQSWVGMLAALFAVDNTDKINKIIFTCPGPVYPVRQNLANIQPPDSIHLRRPFYTNEQGNDKADNLRTKAIKFFATKFSTKLASDKEADNFASYLNYEVDKSTICDTVNILKEDAGSGYYAGIMTFNSLLKIKDPQTKIKALTLPVLIMKGQCDNQQWGFTNEYMSLFKNSELKIITDAGHFISVEQPELYIKTILNFVNK